MATESGQEAQGGAGDGRGRTQPVVPAVATDDRGIVTACGPTALRPLGREGADAIGRPVRELLAGPLPAAVMRAAARHEAWEALLPLRHRDGSRVDVTVHAYPLLDAHGAVQWFLTTGTPPEPLRPLSAWTLAQLPIPVAVYDHEVRLAGFNAAMERQLGMRMDDKIGLRLAEMPGSHRFDEFDRLQQQVVETGEMVRVENYARAPGDTREHAWSMYFFPLKDDAGQVQGMSAVVFDTSEQYWARQRLAVVAEASTAIGTTLDVTRTAQELTDLAAGRFADFASVDLLDSIFQGEEPAEAASGGDVVFRRTAQQSVLPGIPESAAAVGDVDLYPEHSPPARALATGKATRHVVDDAGSKRWLDDDAARAERVRATGIHSMMVVPLRARGTTLGLALFLRHRTPDAFDDDDLLLAEEIAARAAVCIDNARRYSRERTTALTLQRSMLPQRMPDQAAVQVASRYLPAGSQAGVGGDWFDVIPLSGARVALVVGDVVGHGVHASATMGRLRTAVRTLADVDLSPDELLTHLDDLVIRLHLEEGPKPADEPGRPAGEIGATCLYAVYDPVSRRCTFARAGHPLPAVVYPDGRIEFPELPAGPALGLGGLPFEAAELELPEGTLLALYTDGLVGSAGHDVDAGLALLARALTRPARSLEETCDNVLYSLLPDRPADDIALLVARTRALDASHVATWELPPDPAVVAEARKEGAEQLERWGLGELVFTTELVVSELVTNAIRYASGPIQLRLIRDATLICEVSDTSSTAPHLRRARTFDEGGRGLLLVAALTQRWGTRQTEAGKTIWAEQALP
ncbi:SpoIIE family protein phosphatase [Streptomyces sp. NBC_01262]|uniref:SpoIIE family protein phosphatase n=1 Tax=Streptomyces sp. NBC_01262 TaxID=2903803 RepID=UPI002E346300|nr:SpoIIE family protein phosphatase [Streptomyces sp. NBC_01262]